MHTPITKDKQQAFSLMELLVVISILAIIASILYPNYQHYLIKARRQQAQLALHYLATDLEEYYALHHSYSGYQLDNKTRQNPYYQFQIHLKKENQFIILATAKGSQKKDSHCRQLKMDWQGNKTATGKQGGQSCWN